VPDQLPPGAGSSGHAAVRKPWRPPGPNDTALSTMQGHPGQPGQRGRPGFYEFRDVRLQNRTLWVFSGARVPPRPGAALMEIQPMMKAIPVLLQISSSSSVHPHAAPWHCQRKGARSVANPPLPTLPPNSMPIRRHESGSVRSAVMLQSRK